MIRYVYVLTSVLTILLTCSGHADDTFISGTQDIPLMSGLTIDVSDDMNFDTPVGQVLAFEAQSSTQTSSQIISYYGQILPSLGWHCQAKQLVCTRETDTLTLIPIQDKKPAIVRFEITQTNTQ
ncbi:MAG: hypothetical protein IJY58_05300 [Alphaproteobacteria bacterium]|nr:hypothetical protein [Alphaproteobacteria bacterium]MBQ9090444.1 hypothetical protein [Alphaproteobacteria bacterium]